MSAWSAGHSAEMVWPLSLVAIQAPLSEQTTPRGITSVTRSGSRTSPRSFQTRTRTPSRRFRAPRVVGMHLERRRPLRDVEPAEGRRDALVGGR